MCIFAVMALLSDYLKINNFYFKLDYKIVGHFHKNKLTGKYV